MFFSMQEYTYSQLTSKMFYDLWHANYQVVWQFKLTDITGWRILDASCKPVNTEQISCEKLVSTVLHLKVAAVN